MMAVWPGFFGFQRKTAETADAVNKDGIKSGLTFEQFFTGFLGGGKSKSGVKVNQFSALQSSAVFACVRMLSQDLAKLRPKVVQVEADGTRTELRNHPLARLLRRPNSWQTWFEFATQMQTALVLRGNAYAAIVRDQRGKPLRFVPLNPDSIALYEAPDGALFWQVSRDGYHQTEQLKDFGLMIPFEDVLFLTDMRPVAGLAGLDTISVSKESVGLSLAQEQLAAHWMDNRAQPSGILSTESRLTEPEALRMEAAWKNLHKGLQNAGKTAVFEKGLKWIPLTMTASDIEFLASRRYQLEEIARIFRIPLHMLGASADKNTAAKTTDKAGQDYVNLTISTYTTIWKQKLEFMFGLEDEGTKSVDVEVDWDYSILLQADLATRVATAQKAIMGSIMTPDEGRLYCGYNPSGDPQGDKLLFPSNSTPYGSDHSGEAPAGAGRPTDGEG